MKRGLLIGVGTLGGLGAVFAITPPQFGSGIGGGGARATLSGGAATQAAAPAPAPSKPNTPAPATKTGVSGTFVGGTAQTRWGPVQVQINVKDGIITSVDPLQYPMSNGTDQYINKQAIPLLNGEVKNMSLATAMAEATKYLNGDQSATVGVGGASYTSSGYLVSLQSAIKKAGL
jgi:uncharacterized protein with FMN-binding domain